MSSPRNAVDSHPTPLGGPLIQARPVVSITYKSTVNWRNHLQIRRDRECGTGPRRRRPISPKRYFECRQIGSDPIVTRLRFVHRSESTPPRPAWFVLRSKNPNSTGLQQQLRFPEGPWWPHVLTQPAMYLFAIFAVERSSCLRHMMWTLDREPIFQDAESSIFGCVGNAPRPCA